MFQVTLDCILHVGCYVVDLESVILITLRVFIYFLYFFQQAVNFVGLCNLVGGSFYLSLVLLSLVGVHPTHVWFRDQPDI